MLKLHFFMKKTKEEVNITQLQDFEVSRKELMVYKL